MPFSLDPRPNRKVGIDLTDYCLAADLLGCSVSMIRAVDDVESAGRGFLANGRPAMLFEGHLFHKLTSGKYSKKHPTISYPKWTKAHYKGGAAEYRRLEQAMRLDEEAALRSASWQRFQILGDNFAVCGYRTVQEFVDAMFRDEDNSLEAFVYFVRRRGLDDELRRKDADGFAYGYNGKDYKRNQYGVKIRNAERKHARVKINCGDLASTAPTPIETVFPADCHPDCTGLNNTSLDDRYLTLADKSAYAEHTTEQSTHSDNPAATNPPNDLSSPSVHGKQSALSQTGNSAQEEGVSHTPSLLERLPAFFDKIIGFQGQVERVAGKSVSDMMPRSDSIKAKANLIWTNIVQISLFIVSWVANIPWYQWMILAVILFIVSMAYMKRQTLLGLIRERGEQSPTA